MSDEQFIGVTDNVARPLWPPRILARVLGRLCTDLRVEIHAPSLPGGLTPATPGFAEAVEEIRTFRAGVLYAGGRRPEFRTPSGAYVDQDELDAVAYHVAGRDRDGELAACMRMAPAELAVTSAVEAHLGAERAARLAASLAVAPAQILEVGRMAVAERYRRQSLAVVVVLAGLVLTRRVGRRLVWGTAGMRDHQHLFFARFGCAVLTDTAAYVPRYDDELCVVVNDVSRLPDDLDEALDLVEKFISYAPPRTHT
jgi:predicted GNAT family N-acyltransferase